MFIGRKYQVGIGKETARGTAVVPSFWLPKQDVTIDNKKQYIDNDSSMGLISDSSDAKIIKEWAEGEISGFVQDKSFGLMLLGALGTVNSAVKETTAYNHTFSLAQTNAHQSLTVEVKNDLEQLKYALCVINSLKISAQVGKFVEFSAGIKGKKGSTSANAVAYTTENLFISKHATLKFATNLAGLTGATAINIKSVELSIDKKVEEHDALGSLEPVDYANTEFSVDGVIEASFENLTDFKAVFEAALKSVRFSKLASITPSTENSVLA